MMENLHDSHLVIAENDTPINGDDVRLATTQESSHFSQGVDDRRIGHSHFTLIVKVLADC